MDKILHDREQTMPGCVFDNPSPLCQCGGCFESRQIRSRAKWMAERAGNVLRDAVQSGTATVVYARSLVSTDSATITPKETP